MISFRILNTSSTIARWFPPIRRCVRRRSNHYSRKKASLTPPDSTLSSILTKTRLGRNGARFAARSWVDPAYKERLVTRKDLTDIAALTARKVAWADAYRHTPHGQLVVLRKTDS